MLLPKYMSQNSWPDTADQLPRIRFRAKMLTPPGDALPPVAKLVLSPDQQDTITRAAYAPRWRPGDPTPARARAAASRPEIGDGMVYRACAMVQRSLFHPPPDDLEHHELRPLKRFR